MAYKIRVKRAPSSKSFATLTKQGGLNSVVVMIPEAVFLAAYLESTQNKYAQRNRLIYLKPASSG